MCPLEKTARLLLGPLFTLLPSITPSYLLPKLILPLVMQSSKLSWIYLFSTLIRAEILFVSLCWWSTYGSICSSKKERLLTYTVTWVWDVLFLWVLHLPSPLLWSLWLCSWEGTVWQWFHASLYAIQEHKELFCIVMGLWTLLYSLQLRVHMCMHLLRWSTHSNL